MSRLQPLWYISTLLKSCRALPSIHCLRRLATRCRPISELSLAARLTTPTPLSRQRPCGRWLLK
ncbi:hypothetical protein HBI56_037950 [Parastagonospora nodorum]|uniref:Uncharacterized protein n=1 Tax=Phaeosphaeria nodorum (strain SN15 / ATCC MYA-4574 / FGSC 10173) TaxID=321614 RepID=A0A7U2HWT5_PHANO|nr:hypothetical protein HBH56_068850 [Parastagonospora nodorum]QRC93538.1 hypothetical protein JI435_404020 [Parastagonospora nodorum SN15]KAH3932412.1 hypothetical protein HBH54_079270 [Parastagonospora nodorum]KAH3954628.1 hypothetical protein HBH53_015090 [Parastagonospora nodorum]KAH3986281.1 hypothetical protein HBH52_046250 [Parastagonospora nodorum]